MIKVISCKKKNYKRELLSFLDKRRSGKEVDTSIVPKIIKDIRKNGKKALLKYEKKFSKNTEIVPSKDKVNKAIRALDPKIKKSIDLAYNRIFKFHSLQKPKDIKYIDNLKNKLEYKHVPLQSVGIYVPANLPSTLLMNAVPAKISGVKRIVLANPKLDGKLNPAVLYAAKKVGIKEIYSMGGAQAIASLAYIQKVNKVVGPGNIYVARSKREVFGDVGTEGMVAGPSEICVLADGKTDLNQVITSMIGQAEHDVNSQSILITKDKKLVNKFNLEIKGRIQKVQRKTVVLKSLKNNGLIVLAQTDKQIIEAINEVAPEHLEINVPNYKKYLNQIYNAGSIMIGKYSPMAVSDYNVGTNHVLPTLGSAKFSSGLNSSEFYKKISHITLTKKGIEKLGESATHLAEYEDLDNHAQSIRSRMKGK
ncbi:histidinol dehydrogenase [Candidatus Pelagibacter sp. RS40]|uniref:histidinol dehydrogenase n=1 Tax=Candidatus Pelagibacter sp. RS40 TaxID=1977865 RepID=UPI000A168686|nr:histidinol dehydrogenase [Candidatus Pelagibacter sp. RS40]ARJ49177.1 histidinol dehydrogenase [Candidatus Pelagibacter sp. RS40]